MAAGDKRQIGNTNDTGHSPRWPCHTEALVEGLSVRCFESDVGVDESPLDQSRVHCLAILSKRLIDSCFTVSGPA